MDDEAFNDFLTEIGLAEPARTFMGTQGGVTNVENFVNISTIDFEEFWESLAKTASAMRPANEANRPVFPYPVKRKLFAFRLYCEYRRASGIALDDAIDDFIPSRRDQWSEHINEMKLAKDKKDDEYTEIPTMSSLKNWESFKELLKTRLAQQRSRYIGVPLTYLIRDHGTTSNEYTRAHYDSIDERLINVIEHRGAWFKEDNRFLFQKLKAKTIEGECWTFIRRFDSTEDGRGAYLALKEQAEGPAAIAQKVRKAYSTMASLRYNGRSRNFPFTKYVQRHQEAHNVLDEEDNEEQLTETKKITDFLAGISDPRLQTAKNVVAALESDYNTFAKVHQYLKSELDKVTEQRDKETDFKLAALEAKKDDPNKKGGTKRKNPPKSTEQHKKKKKSGKGYVSPKEMQKMKKDGTWEAFVKKRRAEAEKKKVSATTVEVDDSSKDSDSSVASSDKEEPLQVKPKAKPTPKGKPDVKVAMAEAITKAASIGMNSGSFKIGAQTINFTIGAVGSDPVVTADKTKAKKDQPEKGTAEEYAAARAKSAGAQFGRRYRQHYQAKDKNDLTAPIPKKETKKKEEPTAKVSSITSTKDNEVTDEDPQPPDEEDLPPLSVSALTFKALDPPEKLDYGDEDDDDEEPLIFRKKKPSKYSVPDKGSEYEETLVQMQLKDVIKMGIDLSKTLPHLSDEDALMDTEDEDDDSLKIVSVPRKYLMEANPDQFLDAEDQIGSQPEGLGNGKWIKDTISYVESTTSLRRFASQYKGNNLYELEDPLQRILVQAVRLAELKADKHMNGSLEKEDVQEWCQLNKARGALVMGASSGDPKAVAQLAAWSEAETANKPIEVIRQVYDKAFRIAQKAVNADEKEAEEMMARSDSEVSDTESGSE